MSENSQKAVWTWVVVIIVAIVLIWSYGASRSKTTVVRPVVATQTPKPAPDNSLWKE